MTVATLAPVTARPRAVGVPTRTAANQGRRRLSCAYGAAARTTRVGERPALPTRVIAQAPKAPWLLMMSKMSLARPWTDFTFPYQLEPPAFDWPAA